MEWTVRTRAWAMTAVKEAKARIGRRRGPCRQVRIAAHIFYVEVCSNEGIVGPRDEVKAKALHLPHARALMDRNDMTVAFCACVVHFTLKSYFISAGVVVGVLEEGRRPYVVTIPPEEVAGTGPVGGGAMTTVTAVPMDPRVPKIRIKTRQLAQVRAQDECLTWIPYSYCSNMREPLLFWGSFGRLCVLALSASGAE